MLRMEDWSGWQVAQPPSVVHNDVIAIKHSEGTGSVNSEYPTQVAWARSHGKRVWHYLFGRHAVSALAEVAWFKKNLRLQADDVVVFDWESLSGVFPSQAERDAALQQMHVQIPGHMVVLYCNRNFWTHIDNESGSKWMDGLWIADPSHPQGRPDIKSKWIAQQWGIVGGVDQNVLNFASIAAYDKWAATRRLAAAKAPAPVAPSVTKPPHQGVIVKTKHKATDRATLNGHVVNYITLEAFREVERRLARSLAASVIQGSYTTGVGASGNTHAGGGALDLDIRGWNADEIAVVLVFLRLVGFAAWHRTTEQGFSIPHIHSILVGDPDLSPTAAKQVIAYRDRRDGLIDNKPDTFPFHRFVVYTYKGLAA